MHPEASSELWLGRVSDRNREQKHAKGLGRSKEHSCPASAAARPQRRGTAAATPHCPRHSGCQRHCALQHTAAPVPLALPGASHAPWGCRASPQLTFWTGAGTGCAPINSAGCGGCPQAGLGGAGEHCKGERVARMEQAAVPNVRARASHWASARWLQRYGCVLCRGQQHLHRAGSGRLSAAQRLLLPRPA